MNLPIFLFFYDNSILLIFGVFFPLCPPDDFGDEEEVQSFGYKRFGEWELISVLSVS